VKGSGVGNLVLGAPELGESKKHERDTYSVVEAGHASEIKTSSTVPAIILLHFLTQWF
jgi:hypothetical protein